MSDLTKDVPKGTLTKEETIVYLIEVDNRFLIEPSVMRNAIYSACHYLDEDSAKEPHEFKMRDATAEEQKYTQAKIDKIKEPQKCEWNRQGAEDFIITGCGHRPYKVIIDNCGFKIDFCPYCGRKIKVIEDD